MQSLDLISSLVQEHLNPLDPVISQIKTWLITIPGKLNTLRRAYQSKTNPSKSGQNRLVEAIGIEPTTYGLQSRRSPS